MSEFLFGEPLEIGGRKWLREDLVLERAKRLEEDRDHWFASAEQLLERVKRLEEDRDHWMASADSLRIENEALHETILDGADKVAHRLGVARKANRDLRREVEKARALAAAAGAPALLAVVQELERARSLHPNWPTCRFEQVAVITEELGEVAQAAIDHRTAERRGDASLGEAMAHMRGEAVQLAAMAIRFLESLQPDAVAESVVDSVIERHRLVDAVRAKALALVSAAVYVSEGKTEEEIVRELHEALGDLAEFDRCES